MAAQVYKVFLQYTEGTQLRVKLVSGQKGFKQEQLELVKPDTCGGYHSMVDILVATPGRIVDHIQKTEGNTFHCHSVHLFRAAVLVSSYLSHSRKQIVMGCVSTYFIWYCPLEEAFLGKQLVAMIPISCNILTSHLKLVLHSTEDTPRHL